MIVDRLAAAIAFAAEAHSGQVYRGFQGPDGPYILHPLRVMVAVVPEHRIIAVLHDCLEDAGRLPEWLTDDERRALELLTRDKKEEEYETYIRRIVAAPGWAGDAARAVKWADVMDNMTHSPPQELRSRYRLAIDLLSLRPR